MPLFLLSRALPNHDGFWSTCIWTAPESLSKKLIHHISCLHKEEDRFTAELMNLGDSLRWTVGLPEELRSQVVIVVVGNNMRRVLNKEKMSYTPDQTHARNEIKRIYKACGKSITIKHISDIEAECVASSDADAQAGKVDVQAGKVDVQDGKLKLDVDACNALLKSIMGPDNVWATTGNDISINDRRTISNMLCAQTRKVLAQYAPKNGKKSDSGVARMEAAVDKYLKDRENRAVKESAKPSKSMPKTTPKPLAHSQSMPSLSASEPVKPHSGRKTPPRPIASLAPKDSKMRGFLNSLFPKQTKPEPPRPAPRPVRSQSDPKPKADEEVKKQPVTKQRQSFSRESALGSGAGTSTSSSASGESSKRVPPASGSAKLGGRASNVNGKTRMLKVLVEKRALKRLREESAKKAQQAGASPSPAPSSRKRKANDEIEEAASPSKQGRFEEPVKRPSVKLVERK